MNQNPYAAPNTPKDSGRRFAPRLFINVVLCIAIVYGIITRDFVYRVLFFSVDVYYDFGGTMLVILLWKKKRRGRAVYCGGFWLVACFSFSISNYTDAQRWPLNQTRILWLILIPTLTSELVLQVLDWFRRNWSKPS